MKFLRRALPLCLTLAASLACAVFGGSSAVAPTPPADSPLPPTLDSSATNFLAWIQNGHLLVTEIRGGVAAETRPLTEPGLTDEVIDLQWSPSGEFIAFTSRYSDPRLFYVSAEGASEPIDLGAGARPAWSPDSASLAFEREGNLWLTTIENPQPKQLTFESGWVWGNAVFAADGGAIIAAGAPTAEMGAQGNVGFNLYRVPLDGGGALTALPGMQGGQFFGRLPTDLARSPDGKYLAFSTSFHVDACASPAGYFWGKADGSDWQEVISRQVNDFINPTRPIYQMGFGMAWAPTSDALAFNWWVRDCRPFESGKEPIALAEPRISIVALNESRTERATLPINLSSLSFDHSGAILAGVQPSADGSAASRVQLYSVPDGRLILDLGEGTLAALRP